MRGRTTGSSPAGSGGPKYGDSSGGASGQSSASSRRRSRRSIWVVSLTRVWVALSTPATDAPVSSSTPATAKKIAMMLAPTPEKAVAAASWSAWPATPPLSRTGSPSAPNSSSAAPRRHSAPARNGRTVGSTGPMTTSAPAATRTTGAE